MFYSTIINNVHYDWLVVDNVICMYFSHGTFTQKGKQTARNRVQTEKSAQGVLNWFFYFILYKGNVFGY